MIIFRLKLETLRGRIILVLLRRRNKIKKVLVHPHRKLRKISKPVDLKKTKQIIEVLRYLNSTLMTQAWGDKLGMAAPQIGINKRIFIYKSRHTYKACINPSWTPSKQPPDDMVEMCYSLGRKAYKVPRVTSGWAHYFGINGQPVEEKLNGIDAVVYQHELSHLDGKCACDLGTEISYTR